MKNYKMKKNNKLKWIGLSISISNVDKTKEMYYLDIPTKRFLKKKMLIKVRVI
jgi:hypothetical protein